MHTHSFAHPCTYQCQYSHIFAHVHLFTTLQHTHSNTKTHTHTQPRTHTYTDTLCPRQHLMAICCCLLPLSFISVVIMLALYQEHINGIKSELLSEASCWNPVWSGNRGNPFMFHLSIHWLLESHVTHFDQCKTPGLDEDRLRGQKM